jgi:hypothetical protein
MTTLGFSSDESFEEDVDFDDWDSMNYEELYGELVMSVSKDPMIDYDGFIDRFILNAPDGNTYYFRDYEGAEDFFMLNYYEE